MIVFMSQDTFQPFLTCCNVLKVTLNPFDNVSFLARTISFTLACVSRHIMAAAAPPGMSQNLVPMIEYKSWSAALPEVNPESIAGSDRLITLFRTAPESLLVPGLLISAVAKNLVLGCIPSPRLRTLPVRQAFTISAHQ